MKSLVTPYNASPSSGSITSLDGLRGLACFIVILSHLDNKSAILPFGAAAQLGVMLFFTLSGFLMAYHYSPRPQPIRYWCAFLSRRFFRIYPAFAFAILFYMAMKYATGVFFISPDEPYRVLGRLLMLEGTGIMWTVIVECKFYLAYVFIALLWYRIPFYSYAGIGISLTLVVLSIALQGRHDFMSLSTYIVFFIGGLLAAQLYHHKTVHAYFVRYGDALALGSLIAIFCLAPQIAGYILDLNPHKIRYYYTPKLMPFMAVFLLSVACAHGIAKTLFSHRISRFMGHISYSLYLTHYTLYAFYDNNMELDFISMTLLKTTSALFFAYIVYKAIENPCHQFGKRVSKKIWTSI